MQKSKKKLLNKIFLLLILNRRMDILDLDQLAKIKVKLKNYMSMIFLKMKILLLN